MEQGGIMTLHLLVFGDSYARVIFLFELIILLALLLNNFLLALYVLYR